MYTFTIAVLLLCYAIPLTYAEICLEDDRESRCSFGVKDVCISGYEKSKVTGTSDLLTYKYSDEEKIRLKCLVTNLRRGTNFYMMWKQGNEAASNKTTCRSQTINITLSNTVTRTNYTCMIILTDFGESDPSSSVIEFVYSPLNVTKDEKQNNTLQDPHETGFNNALTPTQIVLILFSTICILAALSTIILYVVKKRKKMQKEDKQRLYSPEGTNNALGNISVNIAQSQPQLCENYATPQTGTASQTIYSDPYVAMYSQPMPKHLRNKKNIENNTNTYSNEEAISNMNINNTTSRYINLSNVQQSDNEVYSDPLLYDCVL